MYVDQKNEKQNHRRTYIAIDLKSFYASVECRERGRDPLRTHLVVADPDRTEKTICLAVSPSLKAYGISGRARLFEVIRQVKAANAVREKCSPAGMLKGSSDDSEQLAADPTLAIDYIIAPPRMSHYMQYSADIYRIYLKYVAPEDIHTYSIDEVLIDVSSYLKTYEMTARELAMTMIQDVLQTTGITATAGIGTNLYLCKIAMDIVAKHIPADENGVRIASLDEMSYRKLLWAHRPLTDFWRVGKGYAKKLEEHGIYTMGDIARCSLGGINEYHNENLLYGLFGVNAQLLIDHAWGYEPCTMEQIKSYKPASSSVCSGQVLQYPYDSDAAHIVIREMTDLMALELAKKRLVTNQLVLTVGYDIENLKDPRRKDAYRGEIVIDRYGRQIPKHAHGTVNLSRHTSSAREMIEAVSKLYKKIVNPALLVRRLTVTANRVIKEEKSEAMYEQMSLFDLLSEQGGRPNDEEEIRGRTQSGDPAVNRIHEPGAVRSCRKDGTVQDDRGEREKKLQKAMIQIKQKYGKNAVLKGISLQEGATAKQRNSQIGGHRA